jgi:hypothetical protein
LADTGWIPDDGDGDGFDPPEDCDDGDGAVYPGAAETPSAGRDQDCDGLDLVDVDEDGQPSDVVGGGDCNDADAAAFAGAVETCNLRDDDCDGERDEGCATAVPEPLDPGGIWWVCGAGAAHPALWPLALLVLWRRRAAPLR